MFGRGVSIQHPRALSVSSIRKLLSVQRDLNDLEEPATESGTLSRLGTLKRAIQLKRRGEERPCLGTDDVLVDFNERKLAEARRIWPSVNFFNPYLWPPTLGERMLLLCCLLLPKSHFRPTQSLVTAFFGMRAISIDRGIYLWNPYSIFHHAIAQVASVTRTYVHAPFYPLTSGEPIYWVNHATAEVLALPESRVELVNTEVRLVSNLRYAAFYLTKLDFESSDEAKLIQLAVAVSKNHDVRIFMHPADSNRRAIERLPEPIRGFCCLEPSLMSVSGRQVGLSSVSTIGLELASAGLEHFFLLNCKDPRGAAARSGLPDWARGLGRLLDSSASVDSLADQVGSILMSERDGLDALS